MSDNQAQSRLAARLVVEGILPESTVRAVVAKYQELAERGTPLGIGEICLRKGWITPSELRWLENPESPPQDLFPGIQLTDLLGRGGMSWVYGGLDLSSGMPVAVKLLLPRLRRDDGALARFRAEAGLLVSMQHPNIVKGYYLHENDGLVYLVMEKVDGPTALEQVERAGVFPEAPALLIISRIAKALEHLHSRGLVHRDIKPDNILLGPDFSIKLCDLGLAVESGATGGEITAGTAQYLAPEQAEGRDGLDVRSDIYSLGITLFQLALGSLPFEAESDQETMIRRIHEELRSPKLKAMNISPHLNYFVKKMTARDRNVRYQTPSELIEDIEEQLSGRESSMLKSETSEAVKPDLPSHISTSRRRPGRR